MSILAWIVLGLAAGFLASKIISNTGEGTVVDILLGIVGAVVGGWLFNFVGAAGVTGLNIYSLISDSADSYKAKVVHPGNPG